MVKNIDEIISKYGYIELGKDETQFTVDELLKLKHEKNAVILAHYYQTGDIQDIADYVGDSLQLARKAKETDADIILFAGVHFMAETAKILNPDKKVLIPDLLAGCSLADSCPPDKFRVFKEAHPNALVISYINCTAEIKALTDIICTSSNAETIVKSLPEDQEIIFAPDKNLGAYLNKKLGKNMILWNGACIIHEAFSLDRILNLAKDNPDAKIIAHPESEEPILAVASFIGSTSNLIKYVVEDDAPAYIIATEEGILHEMRKQAPDKILIPAPTDDETCSCSECYHMKRNTLEKIFLTLKYELPEIILPEELMEGARKPIDKMLELSKSVK